MRMRCDLHAPDSRRSCARREIVPHYTICGVDQPIVLRRAAFRRSRSGRSTIDETWCATCRVAKHATCTKLVRCTPNHIISRTGTESAGLPSSQPDAELGHQILHLLSTGHHVQDLVAGDLGLREAAHRAAVVE